MELVGYYRELRHGRPDGGSLPEAVHLATGALDDESQIVRYLSTATVLAATSQHVDDLLDKSALDVASASSRTDGQWAWPDDLSYYVRRYHVPLPSNFIQRVRDLNYLPPTLSDEMLDDLIAGFFSA